MIRIGRPRAASMRWIWHAFSEISGNESHRFILSSVIYILALGTWIVHLIMSELGG